MKLLAFMLLVIVMAGGQSQPRTIREEFARTFRDGEEIKGKNFTLLLISNLEPRSNSAYSLRLFANTGTWFAIKYDSPTINYVVIEVFYIQRVITANSSNETDLLLRKIAMTAVAAGAVMATDLVTIPIGEIRMIRVIGLRKESEEDVR